MENQAEVKECVEEAMRTLAFADMLKVQLKAIREDLAWAEHELAVSKCIVTACNARIKAFGFHDIGHARGELGKVDK